MLQGTFFSLCDSEFDTDRVTAIEETRGVDYPIGREDNICLKVCTERKGSICSSRD